EWFRPSVELWALIGLIRTTGELPSQYRGSPNEPDRIRAQINKKSIRSTPEWRAKMSVIHKERWAKEKAQRAAEQRLVEFMRANGVSVADVIEYFAPDQYVVLERRDGSICIFTGQEHRVDQFIAGYRREIAA